MGPPERIRARDVARITSLSVRKVQELAVTGGIPGAAKLGGTWTFNEAKVRKWIDDEEQRAASKASVQISRPERRLHSRTDFRSMPYETIQALYEKVVHPNRQKGTTKTKRSKKAL